MNNNFSADVAQTQMLSYVSESARTRDICGQVIYPVSQAYPAWPVFLKGRPDQPIRVLLIDNDPHTRSVISNELLGDARTDLVASAATQREGRQLVLRCRFDVMLVDHDLRDGNGLDLITYMKTVHPVGEAIMTEVREDDEHAQQAFDLGAAGYLVKNNWNGHYPQAVLQVANGGAAISPNLARRLLHKREPGHPISCERALVQGDKLSGREIEVLKLIASGHTSGEIGLHLTISFQTVNTHVKNIYRKLQVGSRAQAVSLATRSGIL